MEESLKSYKIEKINQIVSDILQEDSMLKEKMKLWPKPFGPFLEDEEDLRHILDHYVADRDIRSEDEDYHKNQRADVIEAYNKFLISNGKKVTKNF